MDKASCIDCGKSFTLLDRSKIAPELSTMEEYDKAVGYKPVISFIPQNTKKMP